VSLSAGGEAKTGKGKRKGKGKKKNAKDAEVLSLRLLADISLKPAAAEAFKFTASFDKKSTRKKKVCIFVDLL
jgi:hypothetical protein